MNTIECTLCLAEIKPENMAKHEQFHQGLSMRITRLERIVVVLKPMTEELEVHNETLKALAKIELGRVSENV